METFCINLDRSPYRMDAMRKVFPLENIKRISAIDGRMWESGETAPKGQQLFKEHVKNMLVESGFLSENFAAGFVVTPCELATALSHKLVWQKIIDDNLDAAIVLEDDIQPCGDATLKKLEDCFEMPQDADVLLLTGPDKEFDIEGLKVKFTSLDHNRLVMNAFGGCAYVITKEGARRAIQAITPLKYHFCRQWWIQACKGTGMFASGVSTQKDCGKIYGVPLALVEHSEHAKESEATNCGSKPWRVFNPRERTK